MNHSPKAISYVRFSSGTQAKGSSEIRQRTMVREWLEKNPGVVESLLSRADLGKSGYSGAHLEEGAGLKAIIDSIQSGLVKAGDYLLIEALDRLGRLPALEMFELINSIVSKGVLIVSLEDYQVFDSKNLESGQLWLLVAKVQAAHEYSKRLSHRIKRAYENKRINAAAGAGVGSVKRRNAFWLDSDGKLKARESEIVRACIDLYLAGRGTRAICLELNATYPELKTVHPSTIKRWFLNPSLRGVWANLQGGTPVEGVFEPLVSESVFYAIQRQLEFKKKVMSPEKKYSLSGLVCCGECGKPFYFRKQKHNGSEIIYANCSSYLKRGNCSNNSTLPYEVLFYAFNDTFGDCLIGIAEGRIYDKEIEQANIYRAQIAEIDVRIGTYLDILEAAPKQVSTKQRLLDAEQQKENLQQKVDVFLGVAAGGGRGGEEFDLEDDQQVFKAAQPADSVHQEFTRLSGNSDALRDALRVAGYKLIVKGKTITCPYGFIGGERYELMKRSTRFNCYLVHCYTPYDVTTDHEGNALDAGEDTLEVVAIRRDGVLAKADSMDELLVKLEAIKAVEDQENSRSNLNESAYDAS